MAQGNRAIAYLDAEDRTKGAFDSFRSQLVDTQTRFSNLGGTCSTKSPQSSNRNY